MVLFRANCLVNDCEILLYCEILLFLFPELLQYYNLHVP